VPIIKSDRKFYQDGAGCTWGHSADALIHQEVDNFKNRMESKIESFQTIAKIGNSLAEKNRNEIIALGKIARDACEDTGKSREIVEEQRAGNEKFIEGMEKFKADIYGEFKNLRDKFDALWWKIALTIILSYGGTMVFAHFLGKW
jgi:hypothetical protein